ncbi:hypothetical protein CEXT_609701 [Caerostris extrusa]|uniref:Uncharacterized protein n=1 Tax=Caerostris extrusa TaxID=172846 RepID=A0AAV4PN96_CAEEX|nr:hypothetical protein CEXT_609701 [Caerostris extrusa]
MLEEVAQIMGAAVTAPLQVKASDHEEGGREEFGFERRFPTKIRSGNRLWGCSHSYPLQVKALGCEEGEGKGSLGLDEDFLSKMLRFNTQKRRRETKTVGLKKKCFHSTGDEVSRLLDFTRMNYFN